MHKQTFMIAAVKNEQTTDFVVRQNLTQIFVLRDEELGCYFENRSKLSDTNSKLQS